MLLTVVDIHKPGDSQRACFTPGNGKTPTAKFSANPELRITTLDAFRRRLRGYMHEFWLDGESNLTTC